MADKILQTNCDTCDKLLCANRYTIKREYLYACVECGYKQDKKDKCGGCGRRHFKLHSTDKVYVCYGCAKEEELAYMRKEGCNTLYLTLPYTRNVEGRYVVSNFPETIKFYPTHVNKGKHNIAKVRFDVWFNFEGDKWWGVQYGEDTQLLHCRRIKKIRHACLDRCSASR